MATKIMVPLLLGLMIAPSEAMNKKSNVEKSDSVSIIYYPYAGFAGHVQLEIEGKCWKFYCRTKDEDAPLDKKISSTNSDFGLPFYRYKIKVTSEQLDALKKGAKEDQSIFYGTCSQGALNLLEKHTDFKIPFIFKMSPLIFSLYVEYAPTFLAPSIEKIEVHAHKRSEHLIKEGKVNESLTIGWHALLALSITRGLYLYLRSFHFLQPKK